MDLETALEFAIETLKESKKEWREVYRIHAKAELFDEADYAMDSVENCDFAADTLTEFLTGLKAARALDPDIA